MTQQALFAPFETVTITTPKHNYTWTAPGGWRAATPTRCRTCKHTVLAGPDDDTCAVDTHVDTTPLTLLGEAHATLQGLTTYMARRIGLRIHLTRRAAHIIEGHPAEGGTYDVLPAHRCGHPHTHTTTSAITPPTHTHLPADSPAPF